MNMLIIDINIIELLISINTDLLVKTYPRTNGSHIFYNSEKHACFLSKPPQKRQGPDPRPLC